MRSLPNSLLVPARRFVPLALLLLGLTGCSGGGGSTPPPIINVPPVASNSCNTITNANSSIVVPLPASDSNGNSTITSYTIDTLPTNGSIGGCAMAPCTQQCATVSQCAIFTYTQSSIGEPAMDKFTFHVTDSGGLSSPAATAWILNNGRVRIMPLGDSITAGEYSLPSSPFSEQIGYRRKLYNDLDGLSPNYAIDFVGSQSNGSASDDRDNEGHGGGCATGDCGIYETIDSNIQNWLSSNPADIVLLHIGINDINSRGDTSATGIASILDQIEMWETANHPVTVFVAKIIDDVPNYLTELDVVTYNNNLATILATRTNDRVILVDMHDGAGIDYGDFTLGADMYDNVHPKLSGYEKMATKWFTELTNPANVGPKYSGLPQCP